MVQATLALGRAIRLAARRIHDLNRWRRGMTCVVCGAAACGISTPDIGEQQAAECDSFILQTRLVDRLAMAHLLRRRLPHSVSVRANMCFACLTRE